MDLSFIKSPEEIKAEIQQQLELKKIQEEKILCKSDLEKIQDKYLQCKLQFLENLKQTLYEMCKDPGSCHCLLPVTPPGEVYKPAEFQQISDQCDWDTFLNVKEIAQKCYESGYLFFSTFVKTTWQIPDRKYWITELGNMPPCTCITLKELQQSLDWAGMPKGAQEKYFTCYQKQVSSDYKQEQSTLEKDSNGSSCRIM